MKVVDKFTVNIIDELVTNRYAELKSGIFHIKLYIKNELSESDIMYYKYIIADSNVTSYSDMIKLFSALKNHICAKVFFDLKYMLFNKTIASKVFDNILAPIQPTFTLSYLLKNIPDICDGRESICVTCKYVTPASIRFTAREMLMYYFKKYLSQKIYNSESETPLSSVITFNDKYLVDGRYSFFRHYIETPTKPIKIINIFHTNTPDAARELVNSQNSHLFNHKYDEQRQPDEEPISDVVKNVFKLNGAIDFKIKLKINFNKLYQLHTT